MFRTELSLRPAAQLLSQGARVLTIGSCFSDVIGEKLAGHKVRTLVNPFGTVFNPLAAARLLRAVAGEETDWQQHLVEARGRWQSYDLHATVGADSPPALLERIEQTVRETAEFARRADVLVWTLGTAYGYRLRDTGEVVSNCHKVPADRFEKELLTAEEIVSAVTEAYALLRQQNPRLQLVLTVSPVRHLKDTLPLNAVSKSVLRVACHYLAELLPGASYFPAYELMLDDLRDYRFYGDDMLHPSGPAEQYVWEKFTGVYFDAHFKQFTQEWDGIQRALNHRPLHEGAPEHRGFLEQTQKRLEQLLRQHVDVRLELLDVQDRLDALPVPLPPAEPEDVDDGEERIDVGYEDATIRPAAPKAVEIPAEAPPKVTEPTWAEILSAEEAGEEEEDEDEAGDDSAPANEAEAALPGEPGAGKRRKRKRGGRKHKKKNRSTEEAAAAGVEGADAAVSTSVEAVPADQLPASEYAAGLTAAADAVEAAEPQFDVAELLDLAPPLPPVELPAADAPTLSSAAKRRNRSKRKKPALYADQAAAASSELPVLTPTPVAETEPEAIVVPVPAEAPVIEETADALPTIPQASEPAVVTSTEEAPALEPALEITSVAAETTEAPAPVVGTLPAKRARPSRSPRKPSKAAPALDAAAEALPLPAAPEPPALPAPVEALVPEPAPAEPAAAPKRKAAPRRKPAAKAAPAATPAPEPAPAEPAPAPTPAVAEAAPAAPKKRSRPPRRKPDEPAAS
jgi:GSCFA family